MSELSHITSHDLERYCLGMASGEPGLEGLEEHLLWCDDCLDRLFVIELHVITIRRLAIALGGSSKDVQETQLKALTSNDPKPVTGTHVIPFGLPRRSRF